jgi:hypothetical protein
VQLCTQLMLHKHQVRQQKMALKTLKLLKKRDV